MKKRILALFLFFIILISCLSCRSNDDFFGVSVLYKLDLYSECAFLYCYNDDSLKKFSSYGNDIVYPASITKLLTAIVALDTLPTDTIITPGDEVYLPSNGSSSAYIRPHHQLTLEMLIEGMMIPSGNDAAYAVAASCGRAISGDDSLNYSDAVEIFVKRMNKYATELGCTDSNFTTPDGFAGEEHYSTLDDMVLICKAAVENPIITKYASLFSDNVIYESLHTNTWINTNKMLDPESKYYDKNVIGLKTGSLEDNYSLITLYDNGEYRFLIGVFGAKKDNIRYKDTLNIIKAELKARKLENMVD